MTLGTGFVAKAVHAHRVTTAFLFRPGTHTYTERALVHCGGSNGQASLEADQHAEVATTPLGAQASKTTVHPSLLLFKVVEWSSGYLKCT